MSSGHLMRACRLRAGNEGMNFSDMERMQLSGGCLLCSEAEPEECHRSLVVEYLKKHWDGVEVRHL